MSKTRTRDTEWLLYLALVLGCVAVSLGIWGLAKNGGLHMPSAGGFKDFTAGIQSIVTAAGVIVGGSWAYFKFVRGRTYRPRLAVDLAAQWRTANDSDLLHVRVRVTNIGASMVALNQFGSGLQVAFPGDAMHNEINWESVQLHSDENDAADRSFEVLKQHEWIEPGETVSDDLLLDLGRSPRICKLELTLLWSLSAERTGEYNPDDVDVFARRIIAPEELLIDKMSTKQS